MKRALAFPLVVGLLVADLSGARAQNAGGEAVPHPASPGAATAANQMRSVTYSETAGSSLAAGANFFGVVRTAPAIFAKFNLLVTSSQTATATINFCQDSGCATRISYATINLTAGVASYLSVAIYAPYVQVYVTNGAAAGTISIFDSFTAS